MKKSLVNKNAKFGTLPVFFTALSTILGAVLFLRFGWAVGQVGFWGVIGIIVFGHVVTIPTAFAVAEIATNQRVQGGGAYYIISRSFGLNVGGAIGIALYLSQAISVAFYIIAFAEAFGPLLEWLYHSYNIFIPDKRIISIPTMALLSILILKKGANVGMKALYVVVFILLFSILMFFLGDSDLSSEVINFHIGIESHESFFYVFTIVFPAFTGLAAGLGLSGDLKDPKKSIPKGTLWATVVGMLVYIFAAYKFAISATPEDLVGDQLIMQRIALWGPIIPVGLAAASLSSALGSVMVAPRTLQAIGFDNIFPQTNMNNWFAKGRDKDNEPINSSLITIIIAFVFIIIGDINIVAQIISMFFMVTYGAICLISLLEHFAADPAYRPTFKSRWYFSLIGAVTSFWLMFKMNAPYATVSVIIMAVIYYIIMLNSGENQGLNKLFRGVLFQISRKLQNMLQRKSPDDKSVSWRPFGVCISHETFKRRSAFDVMRWISYKYGFGTYIHYINGYLNEATTQESKEVLERLIKLSAGSKNRVYLDTIISPSYTSAIAQVVQLAGISGKGNNLILFEFSRTDPSNLDDINNNIDIVDSAGFDICILNTSYKSFGYKNEIHIWIQPYDDQNASLMILLAYIILGHPEWKNGQIKIFALYPGDSGDKQEYLLKLIKNGRLPISPANVTIVSDNMENPKEIISELSADADLTLIGFSSEMLKDASEFAKGYQDMGNILFVSANRAKTIS